MLLGEVQVLLSVIQIRVDAKRRPKVNGGPRMFSSLYQNPAKISLVELVIRIKANSFTRRAFLRSSQVALEPETEPEFLAHSLATIG